MSQLTVREKEKVSPGDVHQPHGPVPSHVPQAHKAPNICAPTDTLIQPTLRDVTSLGVVSEDTLFIPWEHGLQARSPGGWERVAESRRGMKLSVASLWPRRWARAFPGFLGSSLLRVHLRFQTSAGLPCPEGGMYPRIAPRESWAPSVTRELPAANH